MLDTSLTHYKRATQTTKAELSKKKLTFLTPNSDAETPSSSNRGKKKLLDITNSGESMINVSVTDVRLQRARVFYTRITAICAHCNITMIAL